MLVCLRLMLGIGEGVAFPSASKIIARHVAPGRRGIANSVLAAALAWGPAIGTLVGGLLLRYYGWRPIFIIFGSVTLLWIVPWLLVSKPHWRGYAHGSGNDVPMRQVMRNKTVWAMGIGHFFNTYGFYFLLAWLPLFLVKVRGLSILEMTVMMSTPYVIQGFGALSGGGFPTGWSRMAATKASCARACSVSTSSLTRLRSWASDSRHRPIAIFGWLVVGAAFGGIGGTNPYAIAQIYAGPEAAGSVGRNHERRWQHCRASWGRS